eukprot:13474-Lingulodinium_polyedra.AAC.1
METTAVQEVRNDARSLEGDDARLVFREAAEQRARGVADARGCGSVFYRVVWQCKWGHERKHWCGERAGAK